MKPYIIIASTMLSLVLTVASFSEAKSVRVKGKMRKNGTYVQPHYKSSPDKSRYNNYGSKGNVNPYTGVKGIKTPEKVR